MVKDFYVYGVNFLSVAPGASPTVPLAIQADSDFEVHKLTFASDVNGAAQTDSSRSIPQCTLIITDTGSGRQLMNQAIDLSTILGDGENPFILSVPRLFRANTSISFVLTNYSAAETYNVRLSLIGAKIYR